MLLVSGVNGWVPIENVDEWRPETTKATRLYHFFNEVLEQKCCSVSEDNVFCGYAHGETLVRQELEYDRVKLTGLLRTTPRTAVFSLSFVPVLDEAGVLHYAMAERGSDLVRWRVDVMGEVRSLLDTLFLNSDVHRIKGTALYHFK